MNVRAPLKRSELKEHLARTGAELFYRDGIHAVGVDRIAHEAGVALRVSPITMFPVAGDPVDRIIGASMGLQDVLSKTDYRGCPYMFFAAELVERFRPARRIIEWRLAKRRAWFRDMADAAGAHDPVELAEQLDVLFGGALAAGTKHAHLTAAYAPLSAAKALVRPSCECARSSVKGDPAS